MIHVCTEVKQMRSGWTQRTIYEYYEIHTNHIAHIINTKFKYIFIQNQLLSGTHGLQISSLKHATAILMYSLSQLSSLHESFC